MEKYIGCGKFSKYYYYILLTFLFEFLNDFIYGFNYINYLGEAKLIDTNTQKYFSWHHIIHQIFNYFGTFIFSFCFYKYEIYLLKRDLNKNSPPRNPKKDLLGISLIHNDLEEYQSNKNIMPCLIISFIWVLEELSIDIYSYALKDLDFWMVELIIITYLNAYMFKIQIYKHQKCAIWFTTFPCFLKVLTIILSLFDENKEIIPILYNVKRIFIPIGIIIYLILITLRSYVNTKIKYFMDFKYISSSKLLMYYGLMGLSVCIIICTITTFVPCHKSNTEIEIFDYICKVPYNNTDNIKSNKQYLESFIFYFKTFSGEMSDDFSPIEILYEIIIIISGIITFFFQKYFSILVIKHLTPVHLIISVPIFYFCQKITLVIWNYCKDELYDHSGLKFINIKFVIDIFGDCFSFFEFLIYLEIIELKFYKMNLNVKKNIQRRSFGESYGIEGIEEKSTINNNENQEEDEEEEDQSDTDGELTLN